VGKATDDGIRKGRTFARVDSCSCRGVGRVDGDYGFRRGLGRLHVAGIIGGQAVKTVRMTGHAREQCRGRCLVRLPDSEWATVILNIDVEVGYTAANGVGLSRPLDDELGGSTCRRQRCYLAGRGYAARRDGGPGNLRYTGPGVASQILHFARIDG